MKEINVLKHQLKKKIKISQSLIVVFLITGSITYGIDIADSYINDGHLNEVINFTETTSKLINNGLIDSSTFNSSVDGGEIMNNGIIYNGQFNLSKGMKNFLNLGTIFGRYNSILLKNNGNIVNNGVIDTNIGNYTASTALRVSLDEVVDSKLNSIVNTGFIHGVQGGISFSGSKNLKKTSGDLKEFINKGTISTFVIGRKDFMSYRGVQLNLSKKTLSGISNIENINNSGLISSVVEGIGSTVGFYMDGSKENANAVFIEKFLNNGVISGYADEGSGKGLFISNSTPYQNIQDAIKTIINNGLIKGNETGIFTSQLNPSNIYLNNGILAGKTPSDGVNFTNNGLKIFLDSNGGINKIEVGNGGNVDGKEIVNGTLSGNDSFTLASQLKINDNIIINGAGTLKGSLVADNDSTLYNTIINGYNTALFLEDNTNFVGSNIIINGGGVKNNVAVVKGSDGENSLKLLGDSIVNGNLELENGNDNLVVSNTVQLNGSLDGGLGEDNLNLGEKKVTDTKLNIFQKINNFENILTNGSVVLFETSKITGAKDIVLETGDLTLRIDPTKTLNGKIIGHALYENEGTLSSTGGDLIIGLNGLGENVTISMGKLSLKPDINNKWWRESDRLKTNSLVLDAQLKDGDVFITTKKNLDSLLWKSGNTWNITQEDLNNLLSNNEALLKDGHYIGLDYENAIYHTIKIWTINQSQEVYQKEFDILKKDGKIVEFEGKTYVVNNKNNTAYEVAVKPWVVAGKYDISTSKLDELIASGVEIENKNGKMYAVDRTTNKAYEITNWTEKPFKELTQKEYDSLKAAGEIKIYKDREYVVDSKNNTAYEVAVKPWVVAGKYDISKNKLDELIASGVEIENKNGKMYAVDRIANKAYEISVVKSPEEPTLNIDKVLYRKLNKVYESIVIAGEVGELSQTTLIEGKTYNESLSELLTILDQIYANNPYAYTLKSSRDSLKLFEDNLSYLTIKPKKDEMIVQGKSIYTGVKNDSSDSGKNYYGFDTSHRNYKTTTNIVGGLASFEYGLSDKTSVGVVLGGNNQDINFKGSSKIKGNSLYLGTFTKTDISNFKFMSGIGYQYTSADTERKVSNRYDSFSTGDKYDINSLNAFVEAKYVYNAEQDWTVEPKVRLSYFYIDQDKTNEGYTPGQISMKTDAVNSNTADIEVGVDFVKSLYLNNGKLKNILSLGVIKTIGDKSKELSGYILGKEQDGKKFDIQGVELPKTTGKVSYNLELEQINGMIYTAGVGLEFAKDYNRNINVTVGVGYKF